MALTLDSTLQTAQDGDNHRPVCSLTVGKSVDDYPLTGSYITHDNDQDCSQPLLLSDGRMAIVHSGLGWNGDNKELRVVFSDTEQTTFDAFVAVDDETYEVIENIDAVVLDDSDTIGVICTRRNSTDLDVQAYKVSSAGVKLSGNLVKDSDTAYFSSGVAALKKGTNDFAAFWPEATDGTNWYIYMSASTDFSTWGGPAARAIGGLTSTRIIKDPKILKLADNSYFMVFSYESTKNDSGSIYNLYYTTSSDLSTWADAVAITTNANMSKDFSKPDLVQKSDGTLTVSALDQNTSMYKDASDITGVSRFNLGSCWYSSSTGKLYFAGGSVSDNHAFGAVIDLATFVVEKYYTNTTTPAIPDYFWEDAHGTSNSLGEEHLIVLVASEGVCIIDTDADTITPYYFTDLSATHGAGAALNVNIDRPTDGWYGTFPSNIAFAQVDAAANRLYVCLSSAYYYNHEILFGYIDLTDTTPNYDFVVLVEDYSGADGRTVFTKAKFYPDDDLFVAVRASGDASGAGYLKMWSPSEDALLKQYERTAYPEFPHGGFYDVIYANGKVWALVNWEDDYASDVYKKGLAEIDLDTDQIIYHEPTWFDAANNGLQHMSYSASTTELIMWGEEGLAVFNIATYAWTSYANLIDCDSGHPNWTPIYYPAADVFFLPYQTGGGVSADGRLYMLPRNGTLDIARYVEGTFTTSWAFSDIETLVYGYKASELALTVQDDDSIYFSWTDSTNAESWIKWDKTGAELDLLPYLTGETATLWSIEGSPNRLDLTLSHGHLFDPANTNSILNFYLQKGSKVVLRFGETVSTVDYYANQGSFLISEISTVYQKGTYPLAKVVAHDRRCLWDAHEVDVSALSETYPEDAIKNLVTAEMGDTTDDYDLPTFAGRFSFDAQWIDTRLKDIVEQIANRFGCFLTVDVDDKLTARLISDSNAVDHAYTDTTQIINFTPDDTFSDFVNRIVVTGESLTYTEVLYDEERITGKAGTIGWWGCKKDQTVWYSDDQSRRVRFPRLEVLESASSIAFQMAGDVRESITEIDEDDLYCVVEIDAPNLIPMLVSGTAMYFAGNKLGDVTVGIGGGYTIPYGRLIEGVGLYAALMVLGSVGNYQYEVYGRPVGYVRRSVSGQADDLELQQRIGTVVVNKIEGFLTDTAARCTNVAEFELMLARLQRSRAKLTKVAHLQDQVGDTITFPHPHTGNTVKMFITDIKRKYKPTKDGHFLDEIEGWVL